MPGIIYITLCTERAPFGCGTGAIGVAGPGLISAIGCLGTSGTTMINQYHQLGNMDSLTSEFNDFSHYALNYSLFTILHMRQDCQYEIINT